MITLLVSSVSGFNVGMLSGLSVWDVLGSLQAMTDTITIAEILFITFRFYAKWNSCVDIPISSLISR